MRHSVTAGIALAAGIMIGGATFAVAGAGTTAEICVDSKSGAVRVDDQCTRKEYPLVIEGAQGPAGADGADGADGATGPAGPSGSSSDLLGTPRSPEPREGVVSAGCVIGEVILSAGFTAAGPIANGEPLPITSYEALFSLYGTEFGGDGRTEFGIPDLTAATPNGMTYSICATGIYPTLP